MNNSELCEIAKKHENRGEIEKAYQCYLEAALAEDDGEAMYALAQMYFEGDYVHESHEKAGRYFGLAYDRGIKVDAWTLILAGDYFGREEETEEEINLAKKYYQAAGESGEPFGYECLGYLYMKQGKYDLAYECFMKAGPKNTLGFYCLGKMYDEGLGVEKNTGTAVDYYGEVIRIGIKYEEEYGEDDFCVKAKKRLTELNVGW